MARDLDAMAVIFPFEVKCYADTPLPVEFVGHPFVAPDYAPPVRFDAAGPVLLLPGSRKQAVGRIYPVLLGAYEMFRERPAIVLYPSEEIRQLLETWTRRLPSRDQIELRPVGTPVAAAAVLTSSGTMSMHCALAGIPGAVAYRANWLTYVLGKMLVQVEHLGIANLLLGEAVYPEFIQGAASAEALAAQLRSCTDDPARRALSAAQAARLRSLLAQPAGGTAAAWLGRHL